MEDVLKFFLEYKEMIFIIILSVFLGIEVISHVPAVLHTPLMSGSNAIHGVVVIGAIIVMGHAETTLPIVFGFIAVIIKSISLLLPIYLPSSRRLGWGLGVLLIL